MGNRLPIDFIEEKPYHNAQQRGTLGRKDVTKPFRITSADDKLFTTCTCHTQIVILKYSNSNDLVEMIDNEPIREMIKHFMKSSEDRLQKLELKYEVKECEFYLSIYLYPDACSFKNSLKTGVAMTEQL